MMIDKAECEHLAIRLRGNFGLGSSEPTDVFMLASSIPHLSIMRYPLGNEISGMCVKGDGYSLIAVNSSQTIGRQHFTLAHEFFHLFFDEDMESIVCPSVGKKSEIEQRADCFASYFLLPEYALNQFLQAGSSANAPRPAIQRCLDGLDDESIQSMLLSIEAKFRISRMALLIRLTDSRALSPDRAEAFSHGVKAAAKKRGLPLQLYEPSLGKDAKQVSGDYIDAVGRLLSEDAISVAAAKELLSDAFRDDIDVIEFDSGDIVD